jgi:allantoate deiminase
MKLTVDGDRLLGDLAALAEHGRDARGWTRPALTEADAGARRYMIDRMWEAGLAVRHDQVGNVRARRSGRDPAAPAVLTGSHLDSVPSGGHLDGPLGVAGALAAIEALNAAGVATERPIELVIFVGEEGSRFPRGTLGSAALAGHLPVEEILALEDALGVRFADALAAYGDEGEPIPVRAAPSSVHAFIELHIEQGGILERRGLDIGVVTQIAGLVQRSISFTGDANHAGTTPMEFRRDALLAAAEFAIAIEGIARTIGGGAVATVGKLDVFPNGRNIIPGLVEAICDLRAPEKRRLDKLDEHVVAALQQAEARGIAVQQKRLQRVEPAMMDELAIGAVERAAHAAGLRAQRMHSGAIHDALHLAEIAPASMIFVPSVGGKSHCPEEATAPERLVQGATVLAYALADLASAV